MQIALVGGIRVDSTPDLRTALPRNYAPVPKQNGVSQGYMRPCDGVRQMGTGPGIGRGGMTWSGALYRVLGTKLCTVDTAGTVSVIGDVGGSGQVTLDHSFDRLAIASGGNLWYLYQGALSQVTDANLGTVLDVIWLGGYYVTTDGTSIVATNLSDPSTVSPISYGSAEEDPNKVWAVDRLRGELYVFTRFSIQAFQNVGATQTGSVDQSFPFQVVESAMVPRGVVGTHAYCSTANSFIFLGNGPKEAVGVHVMTPGDSIKVSTREIDTILQGYTDTQLSSVVCERIVKQAHDWVLFHLPDQCIVYDITGSQAAGEFLWHTRDSGSLAGIATYRARNAVLFNGQWTVEDPTSTAIGVFDPTISSHFGQVIAWELLTQVLYDQGQDAILHELELVGLPGRVPLGSDPVVWTSYSYDGETWSQEQPKAAGKPGERAKRLMWRRQGRTRNYRIQRFRGNSDAHIPFMRLEAKIEPLFTRAVDGRPL